jgi:hypothetical protein
LLLQYGRRHEYGSVTRPAGTRRASIHALQHDHRAFDEVLHLLFLVVSEKERRIGRKRFEVFETCRQFIYGVCRDVSTRPDGSILKGPQCGEGFT